MKLLSYIIIGLLSISYYLPSTVNASEIEKMVSPVLYKAQFRGYKEAVDKVTKQLSSSGIIEGEFIEYNPKAKSPGEVFSVKGGGLIPRSGSSVGTLPNYFFWMNKKTFEDWMGNHPNQNYFVYVHKPIFQDGDTVMTMDDSVNYIRTKCVIDGTCSINRPNVEKGVMKLTVDIYVNATWTNGAGFVEKNEDVAWNYYLKNKANKRQVSGISSVKVSSKKVQNDSLILWKKTLNITIQR